MTAESPNPAWGSSEVEETLRLQMALFMSRGILQKYVQKLLVRRNGIDNSTVKDIFSKAIRAEEWVATVEQRGTQHFEPMLGLQKLDSQTGQHVFGSICRIAEEHDGAWVPLSPFDESDVTSVLQAHRTLQDAGIVQIQDISK